MAPHSSQDLTRNDTNETMELLKKIQKQKGIALGPTESQEVLFSSEDEKRQGVQEQESFTSDTRRVSVISWGDNKTKLSENAHDAAALESKQRVESRISKIMTEKKMRDKNSIFHEVVRSERKKSELEDVLEKADTESIYTSYNDSLFTPKKTKCCGLITTKSRGVSEVESSGVVVKRKSNKKSGDSSR